MTAADRHGGDRVADVLRRHGVETIFTLCGGHISPILVGARRAGLRVVDTRHEAAAVFAADACARLTGAPGVAAVTAGPGLTNTATAVQNAAMAQSPVVVLGGATATVLVGRGSLQDIDQQALAEPLFKWRARARRVRELAPLVDRALRIAAAGTPGPVYVECPVDLLYPESLVRDWYGVAGPSSGRSIAGRLRHGYLNAHLTRIFRDPDAVATASTVTPTAPAVARVGGWTVARSARALARAERPLLLIGSQATLLAGEISELVAAIERLGVPVYLSGTARGLLGASHELLFRHRRKEALKEADLLLLAGVPCDFRLDYGRAIPRRTKVVAVNRDAGDLVRNRPPAIAGHGDPARFVRELSARSRPGDGRQAWLGRLREREAEREAEIVDQARAPDDGGVHPLRLLRELDGFLDERALLIADGGDFVATASYVVRPRSPLSWLDPGVFGTLGVGGGFALGAHRARPEAEIWILYGDGSVGFSLAEFDSFARHGVPVIALVGNDASWAQIARDQVPALGDDVGTRLLPADYERAVEGLGGRGLRIESSEQIRPALEKARRFAAQGWPVLINARLAPSDFRRGSISL